MIIKTSELEGAALDWAVATAIGEKNPMPGLGAGCCVVSHGHTQHRFCPSSEWSHGGPLIEKYELEIDRVDGCSEPWVGFTVPDRPGEAGETLLIAAMRAIVAAELGETVDVPEELAG